MGNQLLPYKSAVENGAFIIAAGTLAYAFYKGFSNFTSFDLLKIQAYDKLLRDKDIRINLKAELQGLLKQLKKQQQQSSEEWNQLQKTFLDLFQQVRRSDNEKARLEWFCSQYATKLQEFKYQCLQEKQKAIKLALQQKYRALQELQTLRQIKKKELAYVIDFLERKLSLTVEQFQEEIREYRMKLKETNPQLSQKIIQNEPIPCPPVLHAFSNYANKNMENLWKDSANGLKQIPSQGVVEFEAQESSINRTSMSLFDTNQKPI